MILRPVLDLETLPIRRSRRRSRLYLEVGSRFLQHLQTRLGLIRLVYTVRAHCLKTTW